MPPVKSEGGLGGGLAPGGAVEVAVADGFADVGGEDAGLAGEVGDGAGDLEDAVIGAGAHVEACHGVAQHAERLALGAGVGVEQTRVHLGVAEDAGLVAVALGLDEAGGGDALADGGARLAGGGRGELVEWHGEYLDLQVDAVEQRSRNAVHVLLHGAWGAGAFLGGMIIVAARAGVHRGDEHEAGGVVDGVARTRDGDVAVFERLAHDLEHLSRKFGELVEKQHAVVGQRYFARARVIAAADECDSTSI